MHGRFTQVRRSILRYLASFVWLLFALILCSAVVLKDTRGNNLIPLGH